jgi:uncharacterized repeat protein (TIGR01451 family)
VVPSAGAFQVSAAVLGEQPDSDPSDNAVSSSATVTTISDMSVTLSGNAAAHLGDAVSYTLTATNVGPNHPDNIYEGHSMPRNPSPLISVSGTEWLLDGVPIEGTFAPRQGLVSAPARRTEPFFGHLQMTFPIKELDAMLRETIQTDDQLLVHVTGYAALAAMLDAMQKAGGEKVWATRRVRFEHGDALFTDLIPRVKRLGIIVVEQGTHLDMTGIAPEVMPRIRAEKSQPMRSLLAAGTPLVLSSDEDGPSNPFLEVMLAIGHPNHPSEAISREQAVIAYTRTAAYAEFAETEKGSLAPGKLADLAVLSQDIFRVPPEDLPKTVSVMAMVGGRVVCDVQLLKNRSCSLEKRRLFVRGEM